MSETMELVADVARRMGLDVYERHGCPRCGASCFGSSEIPGDPDGTREYYCTGHNEEGGCGSKWLEASFVSSLVITEPKSGSSDV